MAAALVLVVAGFVWFGRGGGQTAGTPPTAGASPHVSTRTGTPGSKAPTSKPTRSATSALPEMSPKGPDGRVTTPSRLLIQLTKIESVKGVALVPGDISGPAVRVTVSIKNTTSATISLAETVVNGYYGRNRTPADPLTSPGGRPLPTKVNAGDTAEGVYLFRVPKGSRSRVTITVDTKSGEPIAVFTGRMG